jgi:hypothetical protein
MQGMDNKMQLTHTTVVLFSKFTKICTGMYYIHGVKKDTMAFPFPVPDFDVSKILISYF